MRLLIALILCTTACAPGIDGARQALTNAEHVATAAVKTFEEYDLNAQNTFVADAKQQGRFDAATAKLKQYREQRSKVTLVLLEMAQVISTGKDLIPLVESGVKKNSDIIAWLAQLYSLGTKMQSTLAAFEGVTHD